MTEPNDDATAADPPGEPIPAEPIPEAQRETEQTIRSISRLEESN